MAKKNIFKRIQGWYYCTKVRIQAKEIGPGLKVWGNSSFTSNTIVGKCCNFNGMRLRGNGVIKFGNYFHSGDGCQIISHVHNYNGNAIPYDDTTIHKDVTIEDFVWFGSNVLVLGGVTIGEGAIIQAGAVVVKDIPSHAMAGGNPATVFKMRDIEHFERLKSESKFH